MPSLIRIQTVVYSPPWSSAPVCKSGTWIAIRSMKTSDNSRRGATIRPVLARTVVGSQLGPIWERSSCGRWAGGSHQHIHTLSGHFGPIFDLAISADSKHMASGGVDHKVVIWDLESGELETEFLGHTGTISGISFGAGRVCIDRL